MSTFISYSELIDKLEWDPDIDKWVIRDSDLEALEKFNTTQLDVNVDRLQAISTLSELLNAYEECEYADYFYDHGTEVCEAARLAYAALYEQEHRGMWVGIEYDGYADGFPVYDLWQCSNCGEEVRGEDVPDTHPYCHGCGIKMLGWMNS